SLAVYLYQQVGISSGFNRLVFAALLFSAAGDSLLMIDMENGFSYGLFSFLIAHLCYSLAFYRDFKNDPMASRGYGHLSLFLTGIYSLSYYSWIRSQLGLLRIPVMLYIFVISMMLIIAAYRYRRVNILSFRLILFGAIAFVLSDSLLAYHKFIGSFEWASQWIMLTYMAAQFLITLGTIERRKT